MAKPRSERQLVFSSYPVNTQLDVYDFAEWYVEGGGDGFFLEYIASDGEKKIRMVADRIASSKDLREKLGFIEVVELIDERCVGCVGKDTAVLKTLRDGQEESLEDDSESDRTWKRLYKSHLKRIESRSGQ